MIIDKMKLDDGREIIFRYPTRNDLKALWKYYNQVIKETEFLSRIKPISLKEEKKWFDSRLLQLKKKNVVHIIAECDGKIAGASSVERKFDEVSKHVGIFGIAILHEYTGKKMGTRLMQLIEKDAKKIKIELMQLSVYGRNKRAQGLYRKMGFIEAGKIPNYIKRGSKYDDDIIMYKVLK